MPNYWILKSEPEVFSYADLEKNGWTHWDGVRNFQARNNLQAMKVGDLALMYHSVSEKSVVGVTKIAKTAYPDPSDDTGKWSAVRVEPVKKFTKPVELAEIKADPKLSDIALVRQSRLSVVPITKAEFEHLLKLGQTKI